MRKLIFLSLLTLIISGCSARAILVNKKVDYDPTTEARIRVYQTNGNKTNRILSDTSCQDQKNIPAKARSKNPFNRENIHNGLAKRTLKNISIGMPMTERAENALKRSSFFDTDSFEEYVIEANKLALARSSYFSDIGHLQTICNLGAEFLPKAGKDYEFSYIVNGSFCQIIINELISIDKSSSQTKAILGELVPLKKCN
ncbi:hypothetical protein [Rodentibacter caecimuris]|uniref:Lipoprotein n=1 Tax=Rodentibacter caecimuris TaxID=1796644 RepID=A0ABX3KX12_9PAST|nr:hypothetical protein BKG89_07850 [Rodentibacter heylii]